MRPQFVGDAQISCAGSKLDVRLIIPVKIGTAGDFQTKPSGELAHGRFVGTAVAGVNGLDAIDTGLLTAAHQKFQILTGKTIEKRVG